MIRIVNILDYLMKAGLIIFSLVMIGTCGLQVVSRYLLDHPFSWTEELARYSFIWWSFIGAAYVVRLNGHLGMDFLVNMMPKKARTAVQRIVFLISLGFSLLMVYYGIKISIIQAGQEGDLIPISMAWVYAVVPLTGAIMAVYFIFLFFFWTEPEPLVECEWLPEAEQGKGP